MTWKTWNLRKVRRKSVNFTMFNNSSDRVHFQLGNGIINLSTHVEIVQFHQQFVFWCRRQFKKIWFNLLAF